MQWRIHPVFHTDLLTPYRETVLHRENYSRPVPDLIDGEEEYEVEEVLDSRRRRRKLQYLVKWKGYPDSDNQWVNQDDMSADLAIQDFQKRTPNRETHLKAVRSFESHQHTHPMSTHASPTLHTLSLTNAKPDDLGEALVRFPTPEPAHLSPDSTATSLQTLDPATGIRSATTSMGGDGEAVEEGATPESTGETREQTEVVVPRPGGGIQCQSASGQPCTF